MALTVSDIALLVGVIGAFLISLIAGCMIFFFCCGGWGRGGGCCPDEPEQRSSLNIAVIKRQEPNRRKIHVVPSTMPMFPGGGGGAIGPPYPAGSPLGLAAAPYPGMVGPPEVSSI